LDKLYIVARADLPPGLQFAQGCHALRLFVAEHSEVDKRWYETSNNLVVLSVPDKHALAKLAYDLTVQGIEVSTFREPDLDNELTAIAAGPSAQRHLSTLPLAMRQAA
jgi:peptidyl-tRNA hydrolase